MSEELSPAVKGLVERDGKILVLKLEIEQTHNWVLPGGRVDYGEHPLESLEREIKEELSVDPEIKDPAGMYHFFVGPNSEGKEIVLTVYKIEIDIDKIDIHDNPCETENITEYRWMEPEELFEKSSNGSLRRLIKNQYNLPD